VPFLRGGENRMQIKCSQPLAKSQKMCYNKNKSIIRRKNMIIVNTDYITGKQFEMLGLVSGSTIQSKHIGKDIGASFKTLVGGELKGYTEMMNEARSVATRRMVEVATQLGADAIVNVRFASSAVMQGAAEVIVYGTAVKFI
jgi:uncharacterized protein YbjQ (UPF0145 family)